MINKQVGEYMNNSYMYEKMKNFNGLALLVPLHPVHRQEPMEFEENWHWYKQLKCSYRRGSKTGRKFDLDGGPVTNWARAISKVY